MSRPQEPARFGTRLLDRIHQLCELASTTANGQNVSTVQAIQRRLEEPLRIAIAGRIKSGKSTLLNALVGERLAATDAGECTRLVTWYRRGDSYEVRGVLRDGSNRELGFRRQDGVLEIDLADHATDEIDWLEVIWPSGRLARFTLIDTPGMESLDEARSTRTKQLLGIEEAEESQVDAVVYLMRHLHRSDADFLEAFMDRSLSRPSPVNAVAVLSRADEIGAGRLDAMESASAIARRYSTDPFVRAYCTAVLPVAGLLAETGFTLREAEVANLRDLASTPPDILDGMLLSVERFSEPGVGPLTSENRRDLLLRLGLFGVRYCIRELQEHPDTTASQLAKHLVSASGIERVIEVLEDHLGSRSAVLKARSALVELRALARRLETLDPNESNKLETEIERVETGAHEFAELRLLHLLLTGTIEVSDEHHEEIIRLTTDGDPAKRLGLSPDTNSDVEKSLALDRLEEWRQRASHPMNNRTTAAAFETVAQSYERIYAELDANG